ncbi:MAG: gliding motility-associated C-terminal domain-containing protein [Chitinophagales bacterium]|nr:gliding motility-associated C-terminal domain-containing protein [Chitinophagales bacterium]
MKKFYVLLGFIACFAMNAMSQGWLMGGEFQFRQYPNDPNKVIVTLNIYRQCQGGGFPNWNSVRIFYNAPSCCLKTLETHVLPRVGSLSNKEVSPLCPFNPILTTCTLPSSSAPGARIYVYADTINLKGLKCDDWRFRYTASASGNDTVPEPTPPTNPPNPWMHRANARNVSAAGENKYFTITGVYSNKIPTTCGGTTYIGNTSPLYVANPIIYLCEGQDREIELGYYDVDGDILKFEPTQPLGKDPSTPLIFGGGASFTDPFGPQATALGEYFIFDTACGKFKLKVIVSKLGYYVFAFKIKEYRVVSPGCPPQLIGETTRDVVITVINTPNCGDPNSVTKQSYYDPINPQNLNGNVIMKPGGTCNQQVEGCKGRLLKFDVIAYAVNTAPGAALNMIVTEPPSVDRANIKMTSDYVDGIGFAPKVGTGYFEWNVPANQKPGKYPFLFQIRDCIDGFIVSKQLLIEVIIDDPTKIDKDSMIFCPSGNIQQAKIIGGPKAAWRVISGDFNASTDPPVGPAGAPSVESFTLDIVTINQNTCFEALSANFCDNKDTICVNAVPDLTLTLDPGGTVSKCYMDTLGLSVSTVPAEGPFTYSWFSNCMITPNNAASAVGTVCQPFTIFKVTVTGGNGCNMTLSKNVAWLGIRPTTFMTTDRKFVCPLDTIRISTEISDALCGQDDYNTCSTDSAIAKIEDVRVAPGAFPQLYAGQLRSGRTQVLYRGSELYKAGFRPGKVREISFEVESFVNPITYENIELFYKCTNLDSLKVGSFETGMIPIKGKILFQFLQIGWNDYPLDPGLEFTWDGKTNIIFELRYTCNATQKASARTRDQVTQYTSIIGTYWDKATLQSPTPTWSNNFRPNLKMKSCKFEPINYTYTWSPSYGLTDSTIKNPKVVLNQPVTYTMTATSPNGCAYSSKVYADYDTNFAVKINPNYRDKCNFDTIEIHAKPNIIPEKKPYTFNCISTVDPDKNCDTASDKSTAKIGSGVLSSSTFTAATPFKGNVTDGRTQMLYLASELKGAGLKAGLIDQISFLVMSKGSTTGYAGLTIKMACTGLNTFSTAVFQPSTNFHQVYKNDYITTIGENFFKLDDPYEWDGTSNIIVEICFDNTGTFSTGAVDNVEMTQFLPAAGNNRLIQAGVNNSSGCAMNAQSTTNYRPNLKFFMCKPVPPKSPLVYKYEWIPNYQINNIAAKDVIVWNDVTTKYVIRATYQNGCKVYDTIRVNVGKPAVDFLPSPAVVCKGEEIDLDILNVSSTTYEYKWSDQPDYVLNPLRTVAPKTPKYYYVRTRATPGKDTLCYRDDSVLVNIQEKSTMPNLGDKAVICEGGNIELSVDSFTGYKNVKWLYNGVPIASGYKFKATLPGTYYATVDSGACNNLSTPKLLEERPLETAKVFPPVVNICKGEIATIFYQGSSGVGNVDWNRGNPSPLKERVFITDAGKVFLKDPQNQYGCPMLVDTAIVNVFDTPSVDLGPDKTFCQGVGQEVELKVTNPTVGANYIWNDNVLGAGRIVSKSGRYTVTANLNGCLKSASINVTNDTIGSIFLGPKMAQCCGQVIDHLPVAVEDPKYTRFLWSTGDITPNLYLKDNDKNGRFWLKAYKANGCYDEGYLDIENKCSELELVYEKNEIYLGQNNKGYAKHLNGITGTRTYAWNAKDVANPVGPGFTRDAIFGPIDTGLVYYRVTTKSVDSTYNPPFVCEETVELPFRVLPADIYIPKIFSPNGDNVNDFLKITKKGEVNLREVRVYNRWGELMHDDPNTPWDGSFKGQPQPSGTYILYVVYDRVEVRQPRSEAKLEFPITLIR